MRQRITYLVVGGWNTLFGYMTFAGLQLAFGNRVHYLILLVVSMTLATLNAFLGYRIFVFGVRGQIVRDFARFSTVYLLILGINLAALPLLVEVVHLPVLLAQGVILSVTIVVSFVAHRDYSFRRPEEKRS